MSILLLTSHVHTNTSSYAQTPLLGVFPSWWLRELRLTGHERLGQRHTARQEQPLNPEFVPIPNPCGSLTVTKNTADSHPPDESRLESRTESMASEAGGIQSHVIQRVNTSSGVPGRLLMKTILTNGTILSWSKMQIIWGHKDPPGGFAGLCTLWDNVTA